MSSCHPIKRHITTYQDDTFIYWYDVLLRRTTRQHFYLVVSCALQKTTRWHFYLLTHIIPVKNSLKTPGDFQKNPLYTGVLNVLMFPALIPLHGVGSPGDDGAPGPTPGLASLTHAVWLFWCFRQIKLKHSFLMRDTKGLTEWKEESWDLRKNPE